MRPSDGDPQRLQCPRNPPAAAEIAPIEVWLVETKPVDVGPGDVGPGDFRHSVVRAVPAILVVSQHRKHHAQANIKISARLTYRTSRSHACKRSTCHRLSSYSRH